MSLDIKKMFNEELPGRIAGNPDAAKAIGAKFQLNITGEGEWHVDCSATGPSCKAGTEPADVTITVAAADFGKLVENPSSGATMFMMGKLKVQGNVGLAMKLQKLFDLK
ncbi:MAG: SCP2 sterol-binding domain-containing protein [Polyangiaceae bacterium]|nr:SCP2 sterol-binding domain-containing protein [Polyangiaceae bacterium]